ncbi:MAG: hypothetical protein ABFS86_01110 [Planctomycetota bacterium]
MIIANMDETPEHYRNATRTILRFAVIMTIVALLSGVAYRESAKQLELDAVDPGLRIHAILTLALVHGHVFLLTVLLPIAFAGALFLARRAGGADLPPMAVRSLTWGYLTFATATIALMLYKGYHFLLCARGGVTDLAEIDARYFGGVVPLRYGVYGLVHVGLFVTLAAFLVALWHSLRRART